MPQRRQRLLHFLALLVAGGTGAALSFLIGRAPTEVVAPDPAPAEVVASNSASAPSDSIREMVASAADDAARAALAEKLKDRLNRRGIRADEAVLTFKDAEAYRRFLERARAAGLDVVGKIDSLHSVRVRVGDYAGLVGELVGNVGDYASIGVNPVFSAAPPPAEDRSARAAVPVGNKLLAVLGLSAGTDTTIWGRGVLVAVLDGGASPDSTFGTRLRYKDIGYGVTGLGADGGHGTSVASLVAGAATDARGVAPAADLLSIRVTGSDGMSDAFSVAQGILAALEAKAQVINISLGGYATSGVLGVAVEEALAAGVAVVAASGNDQAARLAWPAAYSGVVSVGATDAAGVQAIFSNSGEGLQLTAPGYAIQTAGYAGTRTNFSGTSASAPVVAGSIAALLSQHPELEPLEAADILATHANDGGVAGVDADYGNGTVNLRWAMAYDKTDLVDPAIANQSYDAESGSISVVVQNRGASPITGINLSITLNGDVSTQTLSTLSPGASTTVTVPIDATLRREGGKLTVISNLSTPVDVADQYADNNGRAGSVVVAPAP